MPKAMDRPPGGGIPPNVITWFEQQDQSLLTNRTVRNHLGRFSPEQWPEVRGVDEAEA